MYVRNILNISSSCFISTHIFSAFSLSSSFFVNFLISMYFKLKFEKLFPTCSVMVFLHLLGRLKQWMMGTGTTRLMGNGARASVPLTLQQCPHTRVCVCVFMYVWIWLLHKSTHLASGHCEDCVPPLFPSGSLSFPVCLSAWMCVLAAS